MNTRLIITVALATLACKGCSNGEADLSWLGGTSGTKLVAMVFDPDDADKRREGIVGLSKKSWGLREPHLKGYALRLEIDRDASVRSAAVRALGMAGEPNYLPNIIAALEDKSPTVRWDAAVALKSVVYGTSAVEPLCRHAVDDPSPDVKVACIKALANYRGRDVARVMLKCMSDAAFIVRYEAHRLLVEIASCDAGTDPDDWARVDFSKLPEGPPHKDPWWDWMGVTKKNSPAPATAPATQSAGGG
jgi:hypothetical protein